MKNVRILDCTLRDGGRVIDGDCAFLNQEICEIAEGLSNAKIDIVEIGFLRDWRKIEYKGNSTFFTDVEQIKPFIKKGKSNTMYAAFIDYGMFDFASLKPYDGTSIDIIRFGFTKKNYTENYEDVVACANLIKEKGYKLFVQGVNSLSYNDKELLNLIDLINEIRPYSFGIVDTYGAMYPEDVERIYGLVNHNLHEDICIDFHSHNNYQLSFALAQEIIRLSGGIRNIIIDATLNGMGKVAGNLNTELIVDYLVRKKHYDYEFDNILDLIDDYIYKYKINKMWGYSVPAMMAGIYKAHPNNIIYLTQKTRLETKDIKNLVSMIEPETRQRYDYDNIENLYMEYIADKVDDSKEIEVLKKEFGHKDILVVAPGNSINVYREKINDYINEYKPIVISVNFIIEKEETYAFFGNQKRYSKIGKERKGNKVIISSNVKTKENEVRIVNYHSLINRGYKYFENSTMMLLNLLKRVGVHKIVIAGFDGFHTDSTNNYAEGFGEDERHVEEYALINEEVGNMLAGLVETLKGKCDVEFLTPSAYREKVEKVKKFN